MDGHQAESPTNRGIMAIHLFGNPVMDAIMDLAAPQPAGLEDCFGN